MASFGFITIDELRTSLESDYQELQSCMEAKAWKAVHVLAGSIIEAVLVDYLLSSYFDKDAVLKMYLGELIANCKEQKVLSEKTERLSVVIQSYRNLIHPGRVVRLQERVDENGAKTAQALVEMIVEEVSEKKKEKYGYTAEQIITKLERDPSSAVIIEHILKKEVREYEIRKLLLNVIPEKYFDALYIGPSLDQEVSSFENLLNVLEKCYHTAFELAPDDTKREVVGNFLVLLKEGIERNVLTYESVFFKAGYLAYLPSTDDRLLVKSHLLHHLNSIDGNRLMKLKGLGGFLEEDEISLWTESILKDVLRTESDSLKRKAIPYFANEAVAMSYSNSLALTNQLARWKDILRKNNIEKYAQALEGAITSINLSKGIEMLGSLAKEYIKTKDKDSG